MRGPILIVLQNNNAQAHKHRVLQMQIMSLSIVSYRNVHNTLTSQAAREHRQSCRATVGHEVDPCKPGETCHRTGRATLKGEEGVEISVACP